MIPDQLFLDRVERIKRTIAFENDRATTCYTGVATPAEHMGVKMADFVSNSDLNLDTTLAYINELNEIAPIDCLNIGAGGNKINVILTMIWLSKVKMPGRELPENSLWQIEEKKVLKDEDYDLAIEQGYDALVQKILPQVLDMGELQEFMEYAQKNGQKNAEKVIANIYPSVNSNNASPPFEILCGARSMSQFFMDCYKIPDKVKAAQDAIFPGVLENMVATTRQTNGMGSWVGGWRGASALVSPKIWDELVWPYMYKMGMTLLENGITPTFHLDQNWDRDIERFLELPEKKFILNTDSMTDLRRARKLLGEHAAFMGDVPPQLLATGTPQQVTDYVNRLLDDIGTKGVFITAGCDAPGNAKFENMAAMFKAAYEYN
ncbi:uroporphyrinogen decarboxylase family protein [Alkalibacter mobilis]|uniref:uroporphyrinogen decarboxylase family protein n=1 Tax=Alkalibacter mobilis TaxID=2787712 RepID=UPI00189D473B|nr:uroporphyrinogen decarboxylase family protein [Alkalibacter mobilis]MBF7095677.1 methyltransferase [Alkalibacter mobilis]